MPCGRTPLHYCAHNDALDSLKEIIHWAEVIKAMKPQDLHRLVNTPDNQDRTALHIAAFRSSPSFLKLLISKGADVRLTDKSGNEAVALAEKANPPMEKNVACLKHAAASHAAASS